LFCTKFHKIALEIDGEKPYCFLLRMTLLKCCFVLFVVIHEVHSSRLSYANLNWITFRANHTTVSRRTQPQPQLVCVGLSCDQFQDILQVDCQVANASIHDPNCVPSGQQSDYQLQQLKITCEGYYGPHDRKYLLGGSCSLEYSIQKEDGDPIMVARRNKDGIFLVLFLMLMVIICPCICCVICFFCLEQCLFVRATRVNKRPIVVMRNPFGTRVLYYNSNWSEFKNCFDYVLFRLALISSIMMLFYEGNMRRG